MHPTKITDFTDVTPYVFPGVLTKHKLIDKQKIIITICNIYDIPFSEVKSDSRRTEVVEPRMVISYFLRKYTRLSLCSIGSVFNRQHSTTYHNIRAVADRIEVDKYFRRKIINIEQAITYKNRTVKCQ